MYNEFEQRTRTSAISRWNLQKSVSIVYLYFEIYFHFKVCMNQIRSLSKGRVSKIQQVRVVKIYRACCQRIVDNHGRFRRKHTNNVSRSTCTRKNNHDLVGNNKIVK